MAIVVDDVFFPDRIAVRATCVRRRVTFIKASEIGFEPFRRAVMPDTIREWTIESLPAHVIRDEGLQTEVEKVWHMWEAAKARLYNFKFRPPFNKTVRTGQGIISASIYYQVYSTFNPSGTMVRQSFRSVLPDPGVVVAGTAWTGTFHVAARFDMDEFEENAEGADQTLILPTVKISEVILA